MMGVPAVKGTHMYTQPDGSIIELTLNGDEFYHFLSNAEGQIVEQGEDGFYRPVEPINQARISQRRTSSPRYQQTQELRRAAMDFNPAPRGIVILVSFNDIACQSATTQSSMSEMCNGDNYTYGRAYGSARKYFSDQSNGQYAPEFDVFGPVVLPHDHSYYGRNDTYGNDENPQQMIIDACRLADTQCGADFSLYDSDNDGVIDFVYVIYAGYGENVYGVPSTTIWPHSWAVYSGEDGLSVMLDNKMLFTYACSAELGGNSGKTRCGIGTLCHEFSHVLGLPDFYDTEYGANYRNDMLPGQWDIMSSGSHNEDGRYPCNYTVYEKACFGWATPQLLNTRSHVTLPADGQTYYYITKTGQEASTESPDTIYYIENRQNTGWDYGLPGHGMMVWRVVYDEYKWWNNTPNNTPNQPNYIFIPANGSFSQQGLGTPFPGSSRVRDWSVPATVYSLSNISESNHQIDLDFAVGCAGYEVTSVYNSKHISLPELHANGCYRAGSVYEITYQLKKNYQLNEITVEMGGVRLLEGQGYTHVGSTIRIPSLTGDVTITYSTQMIPFEHDHCMYYFWKAADAIIGNTVTLAELNWDIRVTGSAYRGFDNEVTGRGAQFGSRSTSPQEVVLATDEMGQCLVTEMEVVACVAAGGTGTLSVYIDDECVYQQPLTDQIQGHLISNTEKWHGRVELRFTNLTKALFIKKIVTHFEDETENPAGLETTSDSHGEILGIYNITGNYMGTDLLVLPKGLYLIKRTNGTEKYISK